MRRTRTITKTVTKSVEYRLDITLEQLRKRFSVPENASIVLEQPGASLFGLESNAILIVTWTVTK